MIKTIDRIVIGISIIMSAAVCIFTTTWKKSDKQLQKLERPDLIQLNQKNKKRPLV